MAKPPGACAVASIADPSAANPLDWFRQHLAVRHSIYISQRGNALRFAPHLHVDDDDVRRLLESLNKLIA